MKDSRKKNFMSYWQPERPMWALICLLNDLGIRSCSKNHFDDAIERYRFINRMRHLSDVSKQHGKASP